MAHCGVSVGGLLVAWNARSGSKLGARDGGDTAVLLELEGAVAGPRRVEVLRVGLHGSSAAAAWRQEDVAGLTTIMQHVHHDGGKSFDGEARLRAGLRGSSAAAAWRQEKPPKRLCMALR